MKKLFVISVVLFISCIIVFDNSTKADLDVGYYFNYPYSIDSNCLDSSPNNPLMLALYMSEMLSFGWEDHYYYPIYHSMLIDPNQYTGGQDYNFIDDHDITIISAHGGINAVGNFRMKMHTYSSALGSCKVTPISHMRMGESGRDSRWLHVLSCNSMGTYQDGWKSWQDVFTGIHQIHGFHGSQWVSSMFQDSYQLFAHNSHSSSIALQWKFRLHDYFLSIDGAIHENCPVAYTGRASASNAASILDNEKYPTPGQIYFGYADVYSPTVFLRRYIDGCDPVDGDPM